MVHPRPLHFILLGSPFELNQMISRAYTWQKTFWNSTHQLLWSCSGLKKWIRTIERLLCQQHASVCVRHLRWMVSLCVGWALQQNTTKSENPEHVVVCPENAVHKRMEKKDCKSSGKASADWDKWKTRRSFEAVELARGFSVPHVDWKSQKCVADKSDTVFGFANSFSSWHFYLYQTWETSRKPLLLNEERETQSPRQPVSYVNVPSGSARDKESTRSAWQGRMQKGEIRIIVAVMLYRLGLEI